MGNKPHRMKKLKNKALRKVNENTSSSASNAAANTGSNKAQSAGGSNWKNRGVSKHPRRSTINKHLTQDKNEQITVTHEESANAASNHANYTKSASNWKSANNNRSKWGKNQRKAKAVKATAAPAKAASPKRKRKTTKTLHDTASTTARDNQVQIWSHNHNTAKEMLRNFKKEVEHVHLKSKPHHHKRTTPGSVDADIPHVQTGHNNFNKTMKTVHKGDRNKNAQIRGKIQRRGSHKKAA